MTDIDTSPEAVERLAQRLEEEGWRRAPAILRQLAKERDEAKEEIKRLNAVLHAFVDYDTANEARNAALEEAATLIEDGFDRPSAEPFRKDGVYSKNDKCPHGRWHYEDCEQCASAAIRALKIPQTGVDLHAKAIGLAVDFTTGTAREVKE